MYPFQLISFCDIVINVALDRLASTPHLDLAPPPAFDRMCHTIDPPYRVQQRIRRVATNSRFCGELNGRLVLQILSPPPSCGV